METYIDLLMAQPDRAVTASAVIQAAAVNRSTFYDYFDSVVDLRRAVEDDLLAVMGEAAKRAIASDDALDIIAVVSRTYAEHGELIGLMIGENGSLSFVAQLKESLRPLVDRVLLADVPEEKRPYVAEYVASGLVALYALWFRRGKDLSLEELAPLARSLVFASLSR